MAQADSQSSAFSVVLPTLAGLLFLAAIVAAIGAISLLFPGPIWFRLWNLNPDGYQVFHSLGWRAVAFLFAMATVSASAAAGLLMGRKWAWWTAILLFMVNAAGDLISLIRTDQVLHFGSGIAIASGFIILLLLPPVRRTLH